METKVALFTDYFYQHPFTPPPVELAIKNLFPRAEIKSAVGNGNDNFPPHNLPLHVGVGVVFADIVPVTGNRFMRGDFFQPHFVIVMQPGFVVVDKN